MEDTRLDRMAKALSSQATRRLTLGALLGGVLGHLGISEVDAKKGKPKKTKPWCHCPDGNPANCVTRKLTKQARRRHRQKHPFDAPGPCQPFSCPGGQTNCNGVCNNLQADEANCGTCGNSCGAGQTCCSGVCKNVQADPANCGTCGNVCAAPDVICLAGDCCKPPNTFCAAPGADATCCSNTCLPAGVGGIPFPHCA